MAGQSHFLRQILLICTDTSQKETIALWLGKNTPKSDLVHATTLEETVNHLFFKQSDVIVLCGNASDTEIVTTATELRRFVRHIPLIVIINSRDADLETMLMHQGVATVLDGSCLTQGMLELAIGLAIRLNQSILEEMRLREQLWQCQSELSKQTDARTQQLELSISEVEKSLKVRTQFLNSITRELKAPVTTLDSLVNELMTTVLPDSVMPHMTKLQLAVRQITGFFENILEVTLIKTEGIELKATPFLFDKLIADLVGHIDLNLDSSQTRLKTTLSAHLQKIVVGDHYYLFKLLKHMADAVIKNCSMPTLILDVDLFPIEALKVQVICSFAYKGEGPSQEERDAFCQDYTQHNSLKTDYFKGAGVHLVLAALIAKSMRAEVAYDQTSGQLNTWTVSLSLSLEERSFVHISPIDLGIQPV